jgi:hypothetical protein
MATEHKEIELSVDETADKVVDQTKSVESDTHADDRALEQTQLDFVRMISSGLRRDNGLIMEAINHWNTCSLDECREAHAAWPTKSQELIEQSKAIENRDDLFSFRTKVYIPFVVKSILNPLFLLMIPTNSVCVEFVATCMSQAMNWMI